MARFYLDHHVDVELATRLEADGHDVLRTLTAQMDRADDEHQLEFATQENRILYTQNTRDFEPIRRRWEAEGKPHAGLMWSAYRPPATLQRWINAALVMYPDMHGVTVPLGAWLDGISQSGSVQQ